MTSADPAGSPTLVDEAVAAADGTRTAARWLAASLGGIPSLAVLASIVRAPGNAGFDPLMLGLGVGIAALGAIIGVLLFAWVIAPVPLEDDDLRDLDLTRIPGQPYETFDQLDRDLQLVRNATAKMESQAALDLADARSAEAQTQQADLEARQAAELAAATPDVVTLRQHAETVRARADEQRSVVTAKAAAAAATDAETQAIWMTQLARRDAIRRDAYRLKAADVVGRRYLIARIGVVFSVALIAGGIVLIGLAPSVAGHASSDAGPLTTCQTACPKEGP